MTTGLRIEGLSVSYGGVKALRDVSFEVRPRQLVGLIGPNGAGKTSLIDAISGFADYTGTVRLNDRDLGGLSTQARNHRGLARTWQTADLFDELTVGQNLDIAVEHRRWYSLLADVFSPPRPRGGAADRALTLMGIADLADRMPEQLSQGQRKLVDVARAVAGTPEVLCLDEPAAGLDSTESAELGRRLRRIVDTGTSLLLVDHDMGLVLSVCDHVVVLDFGAVIAAGPPSVVRADPRVIEAYIGTDIDTDDGLAPAASEAKG